MRPPVYSYDPDVWRTFSMIIAHMPPGSEDGQLFLTCEHNSRDVYWFKKEVNVSESTIRPYKHQMAKSIGITKDITNKSGRVTSITRMAIAQVPPEVMALTTGHRNLKKLGRYDRSVYLKHFVVQALLRHPYDEETRELLDFDWHQIGAYSRASIKAGKQVMTSSAPTSNHVAVGACHTSYEVPTLNGIEPLRPTIQPLFGSRPGNLELQRTLPSMHHILPSNIKASSEPKLSSTNLRPVMPPMYNPINLLPPIAEDISSFDTNQDTLQLIDLNAERNDFEFGMDSQGYTGLESDNVASILDVNFDDAFIESIKEVEEIAQRNKENLQRPQTLSTEKLKIMEANKLKALEFFLKRLKNMSVRRF